MLTEPLRITLLVISAFDKLDIPYFIGGSLASAIHGSARSTLDADLVAEIQHEQVKPLIDILSRDFYIDEGMIVDAIERKSSFNLIHLASMFKVDIFIKKERHFDKVQFQRRTLHSVENDPSHQVYVSTAEDIILAKLEWYRMGGEVSDRQWQDILGVLKIQGEKLDKAYLQNWAIDLKLTDLLQKALNQVRNYL